MDPTAHQVDTAKVQRRPLHFHTLADLRAELDRIEASHRAGSLQARGNWTPAQVLGHVAAWIDYGYHGFPASLPVPPAIIRWLVRLRRKRILANPFSAGFRIPGVEGGTVGTEDRPFNVALERIRLAIARLESSKPPLPSPAFGFLSHEEWKQLHLRHAELHLGFLMP